MISEQSQHGYNQERDNKRQQERLLVFTFMMPFLVDFISSESKRPHKNDDKLNKVKKTAGGHGLSAQAKQTHHTNQWTTASFFFFSFLEAIFARPVCKKNSGVMGLCKAGIWNMRCFSCWKAPKRSHYCFKKSHYNHSKVGQYKQKDIMRSVVLRHCAAAGRRAEVAALWGLRG